MILTFQGRRIFDSGAAIHLYADMLENRANVFGRLLRWVDPEAELQGDQWDEADPLYLIAVNNEGTYRGSLRLLPTTGPNMLADIFSNLLRESVIRSPAIWESSRIV